MLFLLKKLNNDSKRQAEKKTEALEIFGINYIISKIIKIFLINTVLIFNHRKKCNSISGENILKRISAEQTFSVCYGRNAEGTLEHLCEI